MSEQSLEQLKELEKSFVDVYTKFKLHFYRKIFNRFETREASLTAVETFSVEVIDALDKPTINEFAKFVEVSQANAAYKIQSLIEKGYVIKKRSEIDKREYHLSVTDKFHHYNSLNLDYVNIVVGRMNERLSDKDLAVFKNIIDTITHELMPEIKISNTEN